MARFHIEPTSKCTLECPLCDRTWFEKKFNKRLLHEIDVDDIVRFLGNNNTLQICGNRGDPIYHSRFIELCSRLKTNKNTLDIATNGSAKTKAWWEKLVAILDDKDSITFAIDGLEDTNHIYRKNAKWKSIMTAVDSTTGKGFKTIWKFIVFKHNQHQIDQARSLSKELGFDEFKIVHSHRWDDRKDLMPDKEYTQDKIRQKEVDPNETNGKMIPACLLKKDCIEMYIDSEGDFYPCCYMGTYRYKYKSVFKPTNKKYNIKNHNLKDILDDKAVKDFYESTKQFTSAHECCKIHCGNLNV
jgi:MoaA/NifB/PqqE/SkfB family radical SAM enzyme